MKNIIAFLCAALLGVAAGLGCSSAYAVEVVGDDAMEPALIKGERVILDLFVTGEKNLTRGDVVAMENAIYHDTGEGSQMLKRLVALPGETVSISDGFVWINGMPLTDEAFDGLRIGNTAMTMRTVPEGSFFVLGDNLPESTDSRDVTVGMVREEDILGKVILEW